MPRFVNRILSDVRVADFPHLENPRIVMDDDNMFIVHDGDTLYVYAGEEAMSLILESLEEETEQNAQVFLCVEGRGNSLSGLSGFVRYTNYAGVTRACDTYRMYSHPKLGIIRVGIFCLYPFLVNPMFVGAAGLLEGSTHYVWVAGQYILLHDCDSFDVEANTSIVVSDPNIRIESMYVESRQNAKMACIDNDDLSRRMETSFGFNEYDRTHGQVEYHSVNPNDPIVGSFYINEDPWFIHASGEFLQSNGAGISKMAVEEPLGKTACFYLKALDVLYVISHGDTGVKLRMIRAFTDPQEATTRDPNDYIKRAARVLWEDDEGKDVTFLTDDGKSLKVHSKMFPRDTMFAAEQNFPRTSSKRIRTSGIFQQLGIHSNEAHLLIEFCYFGEIPPQPEEVLVKLAVAASACCFEDLTIYLKPLLFDVLNDLTRDQLLVLQDQTMLLSEYVDARVAHNTQEKVR